MRNNTKRTESNAIYTAKYLNTFLADNPKYEFLTLDELAKRALSLEVGEGIDFTLDTMDDVYDEFDPEGWFGIKRINLFDDNDVNTGCFAVGYYGGGYTSADTLITIPDNEFIGDIAHFIIEAIPEDIGETLCVQKEIVRDSSAQEHIKEEINYEEIDEFMDSIESFDLFFDFSEYEEINNANQQELEYLKSMLISCIRDGESELQWLIEQGDSETAGFKADNLRMAHLNLGFVCYKIFQ